MLTATEARLTAEALDDGESLTSAFSVLDAARRGEAMTLLVAGGLKAPDRREALVAALWAIDGARADTLRAETIWTMPGHLAQGGALTTRLAALAEGARSSVVCSTFNFQKTSGMWESLARAARTPGVAVRVYVDADASASGRATPSATQLADHLAPARVLRTRAFDGVQVRNHAKFLSVDHRWVVITSANFSWSAENGNVELGVLLDDANLADRIERELRAVEPFLYETVSKSR